MKKATRQNPWSDSAKLGSLKQVRMAILEEHAEEPESEEATLEVSLEGHINRRRQAIMEELASINERLTRSLNKWDQNSAESAPRDNKDNDAGFFPKGFGFFLMDGHDLRKDDECHLTKLYELILTVPDVETQDQLLSFLDDFRAQKKLLEAATNERGKLLSDVIEWMQPENIGLHKVTSAHIGTARKAEDNLRECYMETMTTMEKLCYLRKQIDESKRKKRPGGVKDKLGSSQDVFGSEGGDSDSDVPFTFGPITDLLKLVKNVKDDSNQEDLEDIEINLEDILEQMKVRQEEIQQARETVERKKEELEKVQEKNNSLKQDAVKLQNRLRQLQEARDKDCEPGTAGEGRKRSSVRWRPLAPVLTDTHSTQTVVTSLGDDEPEAYRPPRVRSAGSAGTRRKLPPAEVQKPRQATGEDSAEAEPTEAKPSGQPPKPSADRKSSEERTERPRKQSGLPLEYAQPPEPTVDIDPRPQVFQAMREAKFKQQEARAQAEQLAQNRRASTVVRAQGPVAPESIERCRDILTEFLHSSVDHAQSLMKELLHLRENAREEIWKLDEKEYEAKEVEKQVRELLEIIQIEQDDLPEVESQLDKMVVVNRNPADHTCRFCVCNETTAGDTELPHLGTGSSLTEMQQRYKRYLAMLDIVRSAYSDAYNMLTAVKSSIARVLSDLVWGELGTAGFSSLDDDVDEDIVDTVSSAVNIPRELPQMVWHATLVSNTVNTLITEIRAVLHHAKLRMSDIRTRNHNLDQLGQDIWNVHTLMDRTAVELARVRAGSNLLLTGKVMRGCVCPYCCCYNSPLNDGTKQISLQHSRSQRLILMQNVSILQQATGLVLATPEQNQSVCLVSAVDPEVIDLVEEAQDKLYKSLEIIVGQEGEEDCN